MLDCSLHTKNMRSVSSYLFVSALLTTDRVIREVLTEATKQVKPSKLSMSGRLSFMRHSITVTNNVEFIANLKQKLDAAFEEFFVSGSQSIRHASSAKTKRRPRHS
jgi:hypothetical protein